MGRNLFFFPLRNSKKFALFLFCVYFYRRMLIQSGEVRRGGILLGKPWAGLATSFYRAAQLYIPEFHALNFMEIKKSPLLTVSSNHQINVMNLTHHLWQCHKLRKKQ